ncbi:SGNH/GDSL hydrolase family protein [Sphingomonas sp. YL-JM2C]
MFECLFLGDSIGLGTARAVNAIYSPQCEVRAAVGAGSSEILRWPLPGRALGAAIISIGANDPANPALAANLQTIRVRLNTRRAIWLLPYCRDRARIVRAVAAMFGDEALDLGRFRTKDGIHPQSYREVAKALLR